MPVVYETIRVKDGSVPFLEQHVARLVANSAAVGLPVSDRFRAAILDAREPHRPNHRLRLTWDGIHLAVTPMDLASSTSMKIHTATVPHVGYRVKTTDRDFLDRARAEAQAAGADEALLLTPEGFVAEGTLFAVGWFSEATLCVPSLDLGILPSIGRDRVLEVARDLGFPIEEGFFRRADLDGRPVFATTATRGVVRVSTLDGTPVPDDARLDQLSAKFWPR